MLDLSLCSGPVLVLALAREDAIEGWMKLLGPPSLVEAKETASEHSTLWTIQSSTSCMAQTQQRALPRRLITFSLQSRRLPSSSQVHSMSMVSLLAVLDMTHFIHCQPSYIYTYILS